MAEDWFVDVRKYADNADENVVRKIVNYLGIALRNRDSSLVSFSDPEEVARVREKYLRKKLGLSDSDDSLNAGLDWVRDLMSADRTKNRVTVYYLLAHYFGKLDLFGGAAGTSAASLGGRSGEGAAAALGGLGAASASVTGATEASAAAQGSSVTPLRSEPTAAPSKPADIPVYPAPATSRAATGGATSGRTSGPSRPAHLSGREDDDGVGSGWPKWLTWLLIALAIVALFFILRS